MQILANEPVSWLEREIKMLSWLVSWLKKDRKWGVLGWQCNLEWACLDFLWSHRKGHWREQKMHESRHALHVCHTRQHLCLSTLCLCGCKTCLCLPCPYALTAAVNLTSQVKWNNATVNVISLLSNAAINLLPLIKWINATIVLWNSSILLYFS